MTGKESLYEGLSKKDMEKILSNVPEDVLKASAIYLKVIKSKERSPKQPWDKKYRPIIEGMDNHRLPEHKVDWYLNAIDFARRTLSVAPGKELSQREIISVAELSGMFNVNYVHPDIMKIYSRSDFWTLEKGYQDQIHKRFIGPNDIRIMVEEHSQFTRENFRDTLNIMCVNDDIEDRSFFRYKLAEKPRK